MLAFTDSITIQNDKKNFLIIGITLSELLRLKSQNATIMLIANKAITILSDPKAVAPLKLLRTSYILFIQNTFVNCYF